jgi:hypothetical protein
MWTDAELRAAPRAGQPEQVQASGDEAADLFSDVHAPADGFRVLL